MDVFISYSRKDYLNADDTVNDNSIIAKLLTALEQNSITYWIDKEGIYEKDNFAELIAKKIIESPVFLFVSSKSSNESSWTSKEVAVAHEYEKQIVPFRIDESKFSAAVTFYLADIDQVCYYKNPSIGFDLLVKSIQAKLDTYKKKLDGKAKIIQIQEKIQELKDTNTVTNTEIIKYESSLAGLIRAYNSNLKQIEFLEKEFKAFDGNYIPSDVSKDYKVSATEQNKILLSEIKQKDAQIKKLEREIHDHKKINWRQLIPDNLNRFGIIWLDIICLAVVLVFTFLLFINSSTFDGAIRSIQTGISLLCVLDFLLFFRHSKQSPKFELALVSVNVVLMIVSVIIFLKTVIFYY